jgi:hypothetical protein
MATSALSARPSSFTRANKARGGGLFKLGQPLADLVEFDHPADVGDHIRDRTGVAGRQLSFRHHARDGTRCRDQIRRL